MAKQTKNVQPVWLLIEDILAKLKETNVGSINYRHIDEGANLKKNSCRNIVHRKGVDSIHYDALAEYYKSITSKPKK